MKDISRSKPIMDLVEQYVQKIAPFSTVFNIFQNLSFTQLLPELILFWFLSDRNDTNCVLFRHNLMREGLVENELYYTGSVTCFL